MAIKIEDVVNILRHAPKRGLSATQIGNRLNLKSTDLDALEAELAIAMRNGTVCFDGKHYTLPPERVTATKSGAETTASPEPQPEPCQSAKPSPELLFAKYSNGSFAIMHGDSTINLNPAETRKLRRFLRS